MSWEDARANGVVHEVHNHRLCRNGWLFGSRLSDDRTARSSPSFHGVRMKGGFWLVVSLILGGCRIGEAQHPGPGSSVEWQFGIFNPSGLCSKTDQVVHMPGEIWVASETHLTQSGVVKLRTGLKALRSHYRYVVPGAPCLQRSSTDVGIFSGVAMISAHPARPLPHGFCQDSFRSSRIQVAGVQVADQWVHVGMLYGVPKGQTHCQALFQTEVLLEQLVDRIGCQVQGPRIVCGDFNFEEDCLYQTQRLKAMGFVEVQTYALYRWGLPVVPTGRGSKKLDQIWISAELQSQLIDVQVQHDWWPDHAIVQCKFRGKGLEDVTYTWPVPKPYPWPLEWNGDFEFDQRIHPTEAYAKLWCDIEMQAQTQVELCGGHVPMNTVGRAQTLVPVVSRPYSAPCKLGRHGDLNPSFHGVSLKHARWFKQLRRLQAIVKSTSSPWSFVQRGEQITSLWQAIRNAPGFRGGFCQWWQDTFGGTPFSDGVPWFVPQNADLKVMFERFCQLVRDFEKQLTQERVRSAKTNRQQDLNLVFKDCGKESPPAIDSLVKVVTGEIEEVCTDDSSIVLTSAFDMLEGCPVVCNGKPIDVIMHSHDQMWVQDVSQFQVGDIISQEKSSTTDQQILTDLAEVWRKRWVKIEHVQPGQWQQIASFISDKFEPMQWSFPAITKDQFARVVDRKKRKAATGADGVSRSDLKQLPSSAIVAHVAMLQTIESTSVWPQQLCTGFVSSLDKNKGRTDVDAYRPITIYPIVYRLWSSIRSGQALRSIAAKLPHSVFGGIPGKQAREVWYTMSQMIELAHADNQTLCGLVLDIRRAFNALPREPLWMLLHQLSFPSCILKTWVAFVSSQVRRFKVRCSVGEPVESCTGLPEGCGMSVFGMVLVDLLLDVWLQSMVQSPHRVFSFVDDWQVAFADAAIFAQVWYAVVEFTRVLDLDLDMNKSFVWSAQNRDRKNLGDQMLHNSLATRILGAHQNFCSRPGNKTLVDRIGGMQSTWRKLKSSLAPTKAKLMAIRQLAWPRALHGIAAVHLGKNHYAKLRTGAMQGLKVSRIGANPVLQLTSWSASTDPEFWAIVETCRDARSQGNHEQLRFMFQQIASSPEDVPFNGPTYVLAVRLRRLGWTLKQSGLFQDRFGLIDVLSMHWDALRARLTWSWPLAMATMVSHRGSYDGLQWADIDETRAMIGSFGEADQVFLRCGLDGTLYHETQKDKSNRGHDTVCEFCGCPDSFRHRIWECETFAEDRAQFQWGHMLNQLPSCLTCHGWAIVPQSWSLLIQYFEDIDVPQHVMPALHDQEVCHLFTDGACSFPKEPKLRYASFAVTIAGSNFSTLEHRVVQAGHVPGQHQTAYRGELWAMVVAIRYASCEKKPVCLWSDNQSVVRKLRALQLGHMIKPNAPHYDLWSEIQALLQAGLQDRLRVCKVVSHGNHAAALSEVEEWAFWHNALVDRAAGDYNEKRPKAFWDVWQATCDELTTSRILHRSILQVLLQVGRHGHQLSRLTKAQERVEVPREAAGGLAGEGDPKAPSQIPGQWRFSAKLVKHCHLSNLERLNKWWLETGVPLLQQTQGLQWISGLQLYVDFLLTVRQHGPIMAKGRWVPGDTRAIIPHAVTTGRRVRMFLTMWKALLGDNGMGVACKLCRPNSSVIAFWGQAYRLCWDRTRLDRVDELLWKIRKKQLVKPQELDEIDLLHFLP